MAKLNIKNFLSKYWKISVLIFVLLIVLNILFAYLFLNSVNEVKTLNTKLNSNNKILPVEEDKVVTESESVKYCETKDFQTHLDRSLMSLVTIVNENNKIVITTSEYEDIEGNIMEKCKYDITGKLLKSLNITGEDANYVSNYITNFVVLGNNLIAFNYSNSIYTYNLTNNKSKMIISREMFKGTEISRDNGKSIDIIGPFVHSYTQSSKFYFYTDVTWGCESTGSSYCNSMQRMVKELKDKKLSGLFEYDYLTGKRTFLK